MNRTSIKNSLVSLDSVVVVDGWITDRFILWLPGKAPGRLHDATKYLPNGCYKLTASGAATDLSQEPPSMAGLERIAKVTLSQRLDKTCFTSDHNKTGARLYVNETVMVAVAAHLELPELWTVEGNAAKLAIVDPYSKNVLGVVMSVKHDSVKEDLARLARFLPFKETAE